MAAPPGPGSHCIRLESSRRISGGSHDVYSTDGKKSLIIPQPQENHQGSVAELCSVPEHPYQRRAPHQGQFSQYDPGPLARAVGASSYSRVVCLLFLVDFGF